VAQGTVVEYFVVDGSDSPLKCLPAEDWELVDHGPADMQPTVEGVQLERQSLDRYYLWESQVYRRRSGCSRPRSPRVPGGTSSGCARRA
jgi:hypothetical protein